MAFALLDHTEEKTTIDEILTGTFREKDRQINFAIEELEKIKAEIERMPEEYIFKTYSLKNICKDVNKIIDNHIAELKGENEK